MKNNKVALLANYDWSNVGYEFAQALKTVGVDADMWVWNKHPFKYYNEGLQFRSREHAYDMVNKADTLVYMHSQFVKTGVDIGSKNCFVFHGGSKYRENANEVNLLFNPFVKKSLIQTLNLWDKGAKDEVWMLPTINIQRVQGDFRYQAGDRLIIGHYPGESVHKGSDRINSVISRLKGDSDLARRFEYRHSRKSVCWKESLKRMSECDIYIENLNRGAWGVTALEAAALGCIVVTNFSDLPRYKKEYGDGFGPFVANDETYLEAVLITLLLSGREALHSCSLTCRQWAELHGYQNTGLRLKEILYEL